MRYFTGHGGVARTGASRVYGLSLALIMTAFALRADTSTFTSCNSGKTTLSPCGGGFLDAMAAAAASDNSILSGIGLRSPLTPIAGGQIMSTSAMAVASSGGSATAQASAFGTFVSTGPPRTGFIEFDVSLDQLHGGDSTVVLTDGVHTYSYDALTASGSTPRTGACFEGCQWFADVPFDLGADFQVTVKSDDSESTSTGSPFVNHGDTDAIVEFELLGSNGAPVPFSAVPEPSTWALLLVGFAPAFAFWRRRRCKAL